nr:adenylate/guanylate cyclase domain-containing protein [Treponema sp.]
KELEETVELRTHELKIANEKANNLLLNILPAPVARELTENPGKTISKKYPNATVLFTDIVGFTKMSSSMTAEETVTMLNRMISLFDERAEREGVEKIKTIGDAYMAVTGLSENSQNDGVLRMLRFAYGLLKDVASFNKTYNQNIQIRVGINSGNLVAGVIGKNKFIYDVWGDTVNVASRMESSGQPMKIHVSESVYKQSNQKVPYTGAVQIDVKGKGLMNTYFVGK